MMVGISLDSLEAEIHDSFRGMPGTWKKTTQGISSLIGAGVQVQIQTTATRRNLQEIPKLVEYASNSGASAFHLFFLVCTGRGQKSSDLSPEQYEGALVMLASLQTNYKDMLLRARCAPHFVRFARAEKVVTGCLAGTFYCRITPEVDVTPCPYLPQIAGNLREESFIKIWQESSIFKKF